MSVAAVVVTHQSRPLMDTCLDSLERHAAAADLTVLVADSGSTDGIEELCRSRGVAFLPGPNRGFGAAVNRALGHAAVRAARYVLILNPDVAIARGTLAGWIADCDDRPGCGVFGPRQLDEHGRRLDTIGREPTPADYWLGARTLDADWIHDKAAYARETRCDWVIGSFLLVRRELLDELGGFDERFFLFSEEVDLCTRARRAGRGVLYLPTLTVTHRVGARPLDRHREQRVMWSQLIYARKWHGPAGHASMRAALVVRLVHKIVRRGLVEGRDVREPWYHLLAVLRFRERLYGPAGP